MEKNMIMSEKEFMDFGRDTLKEYANNSDVAHKIIMDRITNIINELDKVASVADEPICLTMEDLKVLAHMVNLTHMAGMARDIEIEEAQRLVSCELALITSSSKMTDFLTIMQMLPEELIDILHKTFAQMIADERNRGE